MTHTESDLRELLEEHAHGRAGQEPAAQFDAIVRRGRRMRRTRRAATAGTALAVAAVAAAGLTSLLPPGTQRGEGAAVAQQPADSARVVTRGPELPGTLPVVLGARKFDLGLIQSRRFETVGVARKVTYTPTSVFTGFAVVCEDQRSWVVVSQRGKGGEPTGVSGRCAGSMSGHNDKLSVPSDWLKRPQSLQVWVFPADAPVRKAAEAVTGCRQARGARCDEGALSGALANPEVRRRLSAMVRERPGRWAIGIYDRPAPAPAPAPTASAVPSAGPSAAPTASTAPSAGPSAAPTASASPTARRP
ncbi:hypothetical protein [Nonomuraea rhodomycinica]|uniref:Uncharacterized protein n=1 Tax=Nonomuraea rhodomycinica TaxID=1712872 RepID=A0A7Y6IR95_9ACTN|nr:hypothetical protein [Nonomuraea rhodomycinica]NUW42929.1 hypothetical protein [Nonomuraea rhodomycinica]